MRVTAPTEAIGCILNAVQDGKTEILVSTADEVIASMKQELKKLGGTNAEKAVGLLQGLLNGKKKQ